MEGKSACINSQKGYSANCLFLNSFDWQPGCFMLQTCVILFRKIIFLMPEKMNALETTGNHEI